MCIPSPPTLTVMHLCITHCTYWTPLSPCTSCLVCVWVGLSRLYFSACSLHNKNASRSTAKEWQSQSVGSKAYSTCRNECCHLVPATLLCCSRHHCIYQCSILI